MSNVHYLTAPIHTSALGRHKPPMLRYQPPVEPVSPVWSHTASWEELAYLQGVEPLEGMSKGWGHRWTVAFKHGRNLLRDHAANVSAGDLLAADPMLKNSWHKNKTARAGVRYLDSTGELHAHASMFERKTLLLLDFHGATSVAAQPFTLSHELGGRIRHLRQRLVASRSPISAAKVVSNHGERPPGVNRGSSPRRRSRRSRHVDRL